MKYQDCISKENLDEKFAATILNTSLELLNQTLQFWNKFPSSAEIVHRLKEEFLPKIQVEHFHSTIQSNVTKLKSTSTGLNIVYVLVSCTLLDTDT